MYMCVVCFNYFIFMTVLTWKTELVEDAMLHKCVTSF
jgi:hypothetical protein